MSETWAERIRRGDPSLRPELGASPLLLRGDNLVDRPWGGRRLAALKGIDLLPADSGLRYGECFELSAFESDGEAAAHPSSVVFDDGSELDLPSVLRFAPDEILGAPHVARYGPNIPLLPKTLDIEELLSVQAHPAGNPEAYFVLEADEGASLRLGFRDDVEPSAFALRCAEGRAAQERLLEVLESDLDQAWLHKELSARLSQPSRSALELIPMLQSRLRPGHSTDELAGALTTLQAVYRETLEHMNEIFVEPGQIIFNATLDGRSAEVHALGNPSCREIVLLEVRRPGVTFRAWDNVRFPMRPIDIERAVQNMSLRGRAADSFIVNPEPVHGRPGVWASVRCEAFEVLHLRPTVNQSVALSANGQLRVLIGLNGQAALSMGLGAPYLLRPTDTLLLPSGAGAGLVSSLTDSAEILEISMAERTPGSS